MFKKLVVLSLITLFYSCAKPTPEIPSNSATFLVNNKKVNPEIKEPTPLNVDIINGFRSLELNTLKDSINLEGWDTVNLSPDISSFSKEIKLDFNEESFPSTFELTFFKNRLISIETVFYDLPHYQKNQLFEKDIASREIFEPEIINTYYNVFGKNPWINEIDEKYLLESIDLYEAALAVKNGVTNKPESSNPFSNPTIPRRAYAPSGTIIQRYRNEKEMTITGNQNEMILVLSNEFEVHDPEGKLFISYSLQNVSLSVKIYNKKEYTEFETEKAAIHEAKAKEDRLKQQANSRRKQSLDAYESATEL